MNLAIIDYQAGNLGNVKKAIESLGSNCEIISSPSSFKLFDGILLPGVGSFNKGMEALNHSGLSSTICNEVVNNNMPILGICLGMHLLCSEGKEGGVVKGLDLIEAVVGEFDLTLSQERIPHMGWNNINISSESLLFDQIPQNADFYFAHSYHVQTSNKSIVAASCDYGYKFPAAIEKGNIFATQFHPEKSQRYGYVVLNNFLEFCKKNMEKE